MDPQPSTPEADAPVLTQPEETARSGRHPSLAPGVALIGPMPDTGFEVQPWLVRRGGTFVQVSELMYELLQRCDGRSSVEQIATSLTRCIQWSVEPDHVRYLIREKLAPLGLVVDGGPAKNAGGTNYWLIVSPKALSTTIEVRIDKGMEIQTINVLRQLPRNSRIIRAVRTAAMMPSRTTP